MILLGLQYSHILEKIKQFIVSTLLRAVRLLVDVKPHVLSLFSKVFSPFGSVGRVLMSALILPAYRVIYLVRRQLSQVYKPAKNKLMVLITNRYSVHVVVALIAILSGALNLQTNEVRAETFGERSLMYSLITEQENIIVEEFALGGEDIERLAVNYREVNALSPASRGIDTISFDDAIAPLTGGTIVSPVISQGSDSTAPRTEIIEYVMVPGDTLSTIAEQFGLSLDTLLWANGLTVRSVLKPGDTLTILPVSGVKHEVKSGDTLAAIAKKYTVEEETVLEYNKLASADDLVVGESLIVPGGEVQAPPPPPRVVRTPTTIVTSTPTIPTTTSTAAPAVAGSGSMVWPTDLRTITQYYGWRHTGIDIDCHFDNDNYAADDGIVQFAGWKGGYGYAVDVNHGNGLVTRYAHNAKLYVSAGQNVSKGQAVGLCGTTGRSTGTHIHFEVMSNGRFRNPLEYIR